MVDSNKYYGVYIPLESSTDNQKQNNVENIHVYSSYEEAHKIVKNHKTARFKSFNSYEQASCFAVNGSTCGPGNPNVPSESTPYRSLKRPEIFQFRKLIEIGDLKSVQSLIWENPRYLISIGDTPTIMQEGPRYNALHIAAKHNRHDMADLILKTVNNKSFIQQLYGVSGDNSYLIRPEVMVDLYLNTPDKALNETPLHFAAKYGSIDVVLLFIQYPQLQLNVKNKHGLTPKDVTCKSAAGANVGDLTRKIHKLLDEIFFIPVWRSDDDVVQPIIGKPFSPKSPPVCPLATSPLSPAMEIKAVAGPMNLHEATDFHKTWKSPVKNATYGTPHISKGILLRSPLSFEKGLEKVGRELAKKFHVSWKEYWPFLGKFVDLASEEGLNLLEDYLSRVIIDSSIRRNEEINTSIIMSPVSELCNAFSKFVITSPEVVLNTHKTNEKHVKNHPYLFMENLCVAFAKNIIEIFQQNFAQNFSVEDNVGILIKKIRNLSAPIDACRKDTIFKDFPFARVHSRFALWITRSLGELKEGCLQYAKNTFRLIHSTDTNEMRSSILVSPASTNVELNDIVRILKCVNDKVVQLLGTEIIFEKPYEREEPCKEDWCSMLTCSCFKENSDMANNNNNRYRGVKVQVIRKIDFSNSDEEANPEEEIDAEPKVTNSYLNCDKNCSENFSKGIGMNVRDTEDGNNDLEEAYFSPASSLSTSEDEWEIADDGPDLFIYNNTASSMDNAALEALSDVFIDANIYPSIYRWKHSILLHSNVNRLTWPNLNFIPSKKAKTESSIL